MDLARAFDREATDSVATVDMLRYKQVILAGLMFLSACLLQAQTNAPGGVPSTNAPDTRVSKTAASNELKAAAAEMRDDLRQKRSEAREEVRRKIDAFKQSSEEFLSTQRELVRSSREGLSEGQRAALLDSVKGDREEFRATLNNLKNESTMRLLDSRQGTAGAIEGGFRHYRP